jgi:hypothetical protein|tara:strand:- start:196 stop:621 length:426 start_codon:yes stop_codon:yes gene_type:complete
MSIKFSLKCECGAKFEGWFPTNDDYDKQLASGQLICPVCDSVKVSKDIMSPNIGKKSNTKPVRQYNEQMVMGGRARSLLKSLEKHVKENFENVGKNFAKEARKAHKGKRNQEFYGTASKKEAKKLLDEGIDLFHVPEIKDN